MFMLIFIDVINQQREINKMFYINKVKQKYLQLWALKNQNRRGQNLYVKWSGWWLAQILLFHVFIFILLTLFILQEAI